MDERHDFDPELHTLRTIARLPNAPRDLEGARFNLWNALSHGKIIQARRWITAARTALRAPSEIDADMRAAGLAALEVIEVGIALDATGDA